MPGAYLMGIYGEVMDEMFSRLDGEESMIASYIDVQFKAPIRVGDVIEVTGELLRIGTRSRDVDLTVSSIFSVFSSILSAAALARMIPANPVPPESGWRVSSRPAND